MALRLRLTTRQMVCRLPCGPRHFDCLGTVIYLTWQEGNDENLPLSHVLRWVSSIMLQDRSCDDDSDETGRQERNGDHFLSVSVRISWKKLNADPFSE